MQKRYLWSCFPHTCRAVGQEELWGEDRGAAWRPLGFLSGMCWGAWLIRQSFHRQSSDAYSEFKRKRLFRHKLTDTECRRMLGCITPTPWPQHVTGFAASCQLFLPVPIPAILLCVWAPGTREPWPQLESPPSQNKSVCILRAALLCFCSS